MLSKLVVGLVLICSVGVVLAQVEQPVLVEWTVEAAPEGGWTVGDRIQLSLRAAYPAGLEVTLPELPQEWGEFEVREQTLLEPVENEDGTPFDTAHGKTLLAVRQATVTLWSPGEHPTPPFDVRYRDADGQLHQVPVPPLTINVVSVLGEGETEKRDLKPQVSLPLPSRWPWVLGGLLLAALLGLAGFVAYKRLRRRATLAHAPAAPVDTRTPEEIAYSELDRIAALDLPGKGELKLHYTSVSDCMRAYVQGRYHIPALDRTTQELMRAMRQSHIQSQHVAPLQDLLTQADLVKFAKLRPPIPQARAAISQARHIVELTASREIGGLESRESGQDDT
jgi:hypothetical protein